MTCTAYTIFGFCLIGLFFQRVLQVRPGPRRSFKEGLVWIAGVSFYRPDALPVTDLTVSIHRRRHTLVNWNFIDTS